jgi:hypothetical protein
MADGDRMIERALQKQSFRQPPNDYTLAALVHEQRSGIVSRYTNPTHLGTNYRSVPPDGMP